MISLEKEILKNITLELKERLLHYKKRQIISVQKIENLHEQDIIKAFKVHRMLI